MNMERMKVMNRKLPKWEDYGIVDEELIPLDDNFLILKNLFKGAKIADISFERHDKINNTHQDYLEMLLVNDNGDATALTLMCTIPSNEEMCISIGEVESN